MESEGHAVGQDADAAQLGGQGQGGGLDGARGEFGTVKRDEHAGSTAEGGDAAGGGEDGGEAGADLDDGDVVTDGGDGNGRGGFGGGGDLHVLPTGGDEIVGPGVGAFGEVGGSRGDFGSRIDSLALAILIAQKQASVGSEGAFGIGAELFPVARVFEE